MSQTTQPTVEVAGDDGPGLRWLFDILVHDRAAGEHEGAQPAASDRQILSELAAVPDPAACRFVLPASSRRVAASSLRAYNAMRPRPVALRRSALATALRFGGGPAILRHRVVVSARASASSAELADRYLVEHLRQVLGVPELHLAVGIATFGPFVKPTLQLFDGAGQPVAYVKIGWNPATRRIVAREADVLARWSRVPGIEVPRLIARHDWHDRVLAVTAPMPARASRVPTGAWPCIDGARAVAAARGLSELAVADSPPVANADATLAALAGHPAAERAEAALAAVRSAAEVVVPHGVAHGDWVPWNLAVAGGDLVVWDWEHAIDQAPLGFDLAHWAYQQRVVVQGQDAESAFAQVLTDTADVWPALGMSPAQAAATAAVHRWVIVTREALPDVVDGPDASAGSPDDR